MRTYLILLLLTTLYCTDGAEEEDNIGLRCRVDFPSCFPKQLDWAELENNMIGRLVFPGDSENYTFYNFQYNKRNRAFPIVHVIVQSAEDIRAAILFAKHHNLRVTVRSSGHDFLGRSSAHSSFSINLREMKGMRVEPNTTRSLHGELKVETGVTWKEIYQEVHGHQRVILGSAAPSVSPGGYTLGGGHSFLSPSLGLAVDNLLEVQVVLPDGRIATCTEGHTKYVHPDGTEKAEDDGELFWAMKGGGGGTFGVVVYFVYRLHPAPESLIHVLIMMPFYHKSEDKNVASALFQKYNSWTRRVPSYWGGYLTINNYKVNGQMLGLGSGNLTGTSTLYLIKFGPWDDSTMSELQEFYDLRDELPEVSMVVSIRNLSTFWDIQKEITDSWDPHTERAYTMGSLIPPERHNTNLSNFLWTEFINDDNVPIACTFTRLGGKVMEYRVNSSSIHPGWRSAQSCVSCHIGVLNDPGNINTFRDQAGLKDKASGFARRLRDHGNGEYINEADEENPNWKLDFWEKHYVDLLKIKVRHDPDNFFSCRHCVGSDYSTFRVTDNAPAAANASLVLTLIVIVLYTLC